MGKKYIEVTTRYYIQQQLILKIQVNSIGFQICNERLKKKKRMKEYEITTGELKLKKQHISINTNQKANRAFFKIITALFIARVTWSELRLKYQFS